MEAQVVINTCHLGQVALLTSTKEQRRRIMQFTADDKVPRFWNHGLHTRKVSNVSDDEATVAFSSLRSLQRVFNCMCTVHHLTTITGNILCCTSGNVLLVSRFRGGVSHVQVVVFYH
jgi:hypothetical protein